MRCKVGDKDGGREKPVPVQMETQRGFWTISLCVWMSVWMKSNNFSYSAMWRL